MMGTLTEEMMEGVWWEALEQRWAGCWGRTLAGEVSHAGGLEPWFAVLSVGASVSYHNQRNLKQHDLLFYAFGYSQCDIGSWSKSHRVDRAMLLLETLKKMPSPGHIGQVLFSLHPVLFFPRPQAPTSTRRCLLQETQADGICWLKAVQWVHCPQEKLRILSGSHLRSPPNSLHCSCTPRAQ